MGIFGWSYPPGAANDPSAPYNQDDPPCPFCGTDPASCECPECETCHEVGNPDCQSNHGYMPDVIIDERGVFRFFSADSKEGAKRNMYKYTDCGAWLEFNYDGIVVGSIVEGCDFGTATYPLHYPFKTSDLQARIDAVEREAAAIWDWANVPRDRTGRRNINGKTLAEQGCDAPDISYDEYGHFEQGERSC